jgi:formylglycine-generating enzyme required for sulfatase activity
MSCFYLFDGRWAWLRVLSAAAGALTMVASLAAPCPAAVVSFGSGANQFTMDFVRIGNPGNAADTNGAPNPAGSVGYAYSIGKFEVSENMITKYNANFGTANGLVITTTDAGANKPARAISWNEAARFVNWLNTSTGNHEAYKFTTSGVNDNVDLWAASDTLDYDASNPYRSKRAKYVLPNYNEWHKAAYYNPRNSTYYNYANGSNSAPTAVASGTSDNTAVYAQPFEQGPADVNQAGGLSPYGVMGLNGNAWEWEESSYDLSNVSGAAHRAIRGGNWHINGFFMLSASRYGDAGPDFEANGDIGFRVASVSTVPEPSVMAIWVLLGLGGILAKRRLKK